ncbi:MAG: ABC transporter ATP-binding protein [Planctomycetota bacterium]
MSDVVLRTVDLRKHYTLGNETIEVLRGVALELKRGEVVSIIGPSGAGKSTLLHLLGLLDRADAGSIFYENELVSTKGTSDRARIRLQSVGFVFQFYHLIAELTAFENVLLRAMMAPRYLHNRATARQRVSEILQAVGLGARMAHRPGELSGGERQRLAIARALICNPSVVFCDEPTGNLDENTSADIEDLLFSLNRTMKQTLVIVTHNYRLARRAHRTLVLHGGVLHPKTWDHEEENGA